ncbi:uncharacterized protein [Engystomops pustulosus]|uniref:uncharacterized protein n=1 Tax=Engystomops pustulosus TaxID=76066 RepID=UPI003AFA06A4
MLSRTTSALFPIIVCTFVFWNAEATDVTENHPATTSVSRDNLSPVTPAITAGNITLSPVLNLSLDSTLNENTTSENSTKQSLTTTPTTVNNSPEVGSTTIASTTFLPSVASSKTENLISTVTKSNITTTVLPTNETSTRESNTSSTLPVESNTTLVSDETGTGMQYSETVLTSIFGTMLVVVLLTIIAFCFTKYRKRQSQYSHHPLHENVYESEGYTPPDDTLVISGGLYDAPRIYNPNMTVLEEEDTQPEYVSFSNRPGQFRLEFLPGDKDMDPAYNGSLRRHV